jgi:hypothetical protein
MVYPWVTGFRYKFVVRRQSTATTNNSASYTLYYYGNEKEWTFFAAWSRPKTPTTYMGDTYSFL